MKQRTRVLFAVGSLALGLGLAAPFRRSPEESPDPTKKQRATDEKTPVERETAFGRASLPLGPVGIIDSAAVKDPVLIQKRDAIGRSTAAKPPVTQDHRFGAPRRELLNAVVPEPPAMEPHFPSGSASFATTKLNPSSARYEKPQTDIPSQEGDDAESKNLNWRRHRVRDGDKLSDLASRYLGRADRYMEIFDANRDVLTRPDILPLGVTIRIPEN